MAGLILARVVAGRRQCAYEAQRRKLLPLLLAGASDDQLLPLVRRGSALLCELTTELIQLVRGHERERLVAAARRLGVTDTLRRRLRYGSARARVLAAETLGKFADDDCTAALRAALNDRDANVRFAAALSMASSGRAPSTALLITQLQLGTREQSMLIVELLGQIARERPGEIRTLVEQPTTPPTVKAAAIEALAGSGDYTLVPVIVRLALEAADEAPELPRYLRALGAFQHPAGLPAILRGLDGSTWWVRAAAAEAAGRIGLLETRYRLSRLLDDPDWWVRFRAGEALIRLGEAGQRLLADTGRCGSHRARAAAQLTLAEQALAA